MSIVARTGDEIVLIEEYRPRLGETVVSCPAGRVEPDEFIDVRTVPVADAIDAIRAAPTCGWSLPPLLLAREEGLL